MITKRSSSEFVLSSGRKFYANRGLVSISVATGGPWSYQEFGVGEGYDGYINVEFWTSQERLELATHMIAQWRAFAADNAQDTPPDPTEPGPELEELLPDGGLLAG